MNSSDPVNRDREDSDHMESLRESGECYDIIEVARKVVSSLDLNAVLETILMNALDLAQMPAGSIALYDEKNETLTLHAYTGLSRKFVEQRSWRPTPGGLTEKILNSENFFVVEDVAQASFPLNLLVQAEGLRAILAMPLRVQEKIVGILYLGDFKPRRISAGRLDMLSVLVSFAAMSIENARLHAEMRELASRDGLTGLQNYRQFQKLLRDELSRSRRYGKDLSLVFFDVDDFKAFNDQHGHPAGDHALQIVAHLLEDCFREADTLFRYGGEEFVALLPEAGLEDALVAAERARRAVERETRGRLRSGEGEGLTVSVGVAQFPRDGETAEDLLQSVDSLMYRAKEEGKNRVYHRRQSTDTAI